MQTVTYSHARENLKSVMDKAATDRAPIAIVRQRGEGSVLISQSEWDAFQETMHLLGSPANAARLLEAVQGLEAGKGIERELIQP